MKKESGDSASALVQAFARFVPAMARWNKSRSSGGHGDGGTLSYPRLRLLGALQCHGPRIMSALSDELGVTPRNVTALVDGLEAERLVERRPHPTDRRATVVALTSRGQKACTALLAERLASMAELFADLPERDRASLLRLVEKLTDALRRRGFLDEPPRAEGENEAQEGAAVEVREAEMATARQGRTTRPARPRSERSPAVAAMAVRRARG